jgi:oxygen-independent coproporphyrinogen-3 oxidase
MQSQVLNIDIDLLKKYAVSGPRYTSYPTAPLFNESFAAADYIEAIEASNVQQRPLSLYFHLPYCRSLCWYCGCNMTITHSQEKIRTYLDVVLEEIDLIRQHLKGDRSVQQLHWGGGSPSYLSSDDKQGFMRAIRERFDFAPNAEIGAELDPRDMNPEDAAVLRAAGFNRISLGVQDVNPAVQQAINRIQPVSLVVEVIEQLRQAGFESINVDLIYGLPQQTLDSFTATINTIIEIDPDRIALFNFAYLPTLFRHQRLIDEAALPSPDEKLAILKMAIETLTDSGYVYIGMDHFAKPDDELCQAQHNKTLYRNFQGYSTKAGCDLLAFGNSAIGQLESVYVQNHKAVSDYCAAIDAGRPATARGYRLNRDDHIRRQVIKQIMCDLEVDKASLAHAWQIDVDDYFANEFKAIEPLAEDGLLQLSTSGFRVTWRGRLLLRNIAMVFDRYLQVPPEGGQRPLYSKTV